MNILSVVWKLIPKWAQTLIKYCYMKWELSWNMCKLTQLTLLRNWSTRIGKHVLVWTRDKWIEEGVEIDDYVSLNDRIMIYSSNEYNVKIWKFCSIWNGCAFIAAMNHDYNCLTTYTRTFKPDNFRNIWATIEIWHDVWVGKNAIILKWVTVWTWAVIWAWAVVTKDVPPYAVVVWNPAKVIKYRFDEKTIKKLLESERWNRDIEKIKKNYRLEFIK